MDWTAADAAEALLAHAISIAENGPTTVTTHEYDPQARLRGSDGTAGRASMAARCLDERHALPHRVVADGLAASRGRLLGVMARDRQAGRGGRSRGV